MVKIGLEIHQQLDTGKLFCRCDGNLSENYDFEFRRTLRPVVSEMGLVDRAALLEARRGKERVYYASEKNSCAVEWDEEPPHSPDKDAIEIATQIALLLNSTLVDEVHFMRKILIDGSAVGGFQRTALIATDGKIEDVRISSVCLEEDSARPLRGGFNLDRLGIPLIEVATEPDITSGEQARRIAKRLGSLFRVGRVRRGLGTIRQDLNISIPKGARVEIKGVQNIDLMPLIVDLEVERQKKIVALEGVMKNKFTKIEDVTDAFEKTSNKIFKDKKVYARLMKNSKGVFASMLHKGKHLGREIAEYVKSFGYKGFIHSDEEIEKYKLGSEIKKVYKKLQAKKDDLIIISSGDKRILELVKERVTQLSNGVSEDTRRVKEDGSTEYLRPLPTGARMYPETDVLTFKLPKVKQLETPEKRLETLKKILPEQIAKKLYLSPDYHTFKELGESKILGIILTEHLPALRRKKIKVTKEHLSIVLKAVKDGKLAKGGIDKALMSLAKGKVTKFNEVEEVEVRNFIQKLIKEKKEFIKTSHDPIKGLMGIVMAKYRGKISGKTIISIIKEELK